MNTAQPQTNAAVMAHPAAARLRSSVVMLFSRTALFFAIQAVFAAGFYLSGSRNAWEAGANWWPIGVSIANLICIAIIIYLFRAEGKKYWDVFRIQKEHVWRDLLALLITMPFMGALGFFPNILLSTWLFGDPGATLDLFIRPLPLWAVYTSIALFPLTQGLIELTVYFAYVMPRLDGRRFPDLRPVLLPGLMLGIQHMMAPFLFDGRFIVWRALMFIPFGLAAGAIIHWRPRLLPYLAIIHGLMDVQIALMLLAAAY